MTPTVTIIVPVYNTEKYLAECLDSILCQTYQDWICFLINDGSTDGSQKIIDHYCEKDSRFVSFVKDNEKSADLARKFGIERADTEFIQQIDSDDKIESTYIERLVARQKETGADCVVSRFIGYDENYIKANYCIPASDFDMSQTVSGTSACLMTIGGWGLSGNGMLFRKSLTFGVEYGPYMNSDEFSQRQILNNATTVAFVDSHYLYRGNEGTSVKFSPRIFDRTMVDMQLESFVFNEFASFTDKLEAIISQRFFNLTYLVSDYYCNKKLLDIESRSRIMNMLKGSFYSLRRDEMSRVLPVHSKIIGRNWFQFSCFCRVYVMIKRKTGGTFWYK